MYAHPCDPEMIKLFQPHLAEHQRIKGIKNPLLAAVLHGSWWLTVGWDYVSRPQWRWGMTTDPKFAN